MKRAERGMGHLGYGRWRRVLASAEARFGDLGRIGSTEGRRKPIGEIAEARRTVC